MVGMNFRPRPMESSRQRHTVEAVVVGHVDHTVGRWFWKQTFPSLKVRFSDESLQKMREILRAAGNHGDCMDVVEVGFPTPVERDEYKIGEVVTVKFSTAGEIDQFFTGAEFFRWDGIVQAKALAQTHQV